MLRSNLWGVRRIAHGSVRGGSAPHDEACWDDDGSDAAPGGDEKLPATSVARTKRPSCQRLEAVNVKEVAVAAIQRTDGKAPLARL
jgi:hypothetical protein